MPTRPISRPQTIQSPYSVVKDILEADNEVRIDLVDDTSNDNDNDDDEVDCAPYIYNGTLHSKTLIIPQKARKAFW